MKVNYGKTKYMKVRGRVTPNLCRLMLVVFRDVMSRKFNNDDRVTREKM